MHIVPRPKSRLALPALLAIALLCSAQAPAPLEGPASPESELALAAREVGFFDYRTAEPHFDKALALASPNSDAWALALYGKATCLYHISPVSTANIDQAKTLYTQLWTARPDHRAGRMAGLALGRIAELKDFLADGVDLPAARACYQAVLDKAPDSPEADQAVLRLAGTYIQTYDKAQCLQGIDILQKRLASHPQNTLASGMYQYIADTYFYPLANDKAALENYLKADAIGLPPTGKEAILYWRMATLADRVNDPKTAIACYEKILQITPTSGKAYEAGKALERLRSPLPQGEGKGEGVSSSSSPQPTENTQHPPSTQPAKEAKP
jgi:tetratricopeptide (TPR) repeat protein